MGLWAAALIYLLLLVDKADSEKGKTPIRYREQSLEQMERFILQLLYMQLLGVGEELFDANV